MDLESEPDPDVDLDVHTLLGALRNHEAQPRMVIASAALVAAFVEKINTKEVSMDLMELREGAAES